MLVSAFGTAAVAGSVLLAGPAGAQAQAEGTPTFDVPTGTRSPYVCIDAYLSGAYAGTGCWSQDPGGDLNGDGATDPGDAIIAYDGAPDGWGIETRLSTGRVASTRGHSSPYWSPWATGNLPEGNTYTMRVCLVRGTSESCSSAVTVTA